jgi:uncharacterized protein (DUF3084 family)
VEVTDARNVPEAAEMVPLGDLAAVKRRLEQAMEKSKVLEERNKVLEESKKALEERNKALEEKSRMWSSLKLIVSGTSL